MSDSGPRSGSLSSSATVDGPRDSDANRILRLRIWQIQAVRDVLLVLVVWGVVYAGYWMRDVTVPLLFALALAYLFEPLVRRLTQFRGITRPGAVTILLLTVGVTLTIVMILTIPLAVSQSISLVNRLRSSDFTDVAIKAVDYAPEQYRANLLETISYLDAQFNPEAPRAVAKDAEPESDGAADAPSPPSGDVDEPPASPEETAADRKDEVLIDELPPSEEERFRAVVRSELEAQGLLDGAAADTPTTGAPWRILGALGTAGERVGALFFTLVQISLILFLIPFYFWFFSVSFPQIVTFGRSLIPEHNRERTTHLLAMMDNAVSGFVRGRIVIAVIMSALFAIGWLLCGVPYAIPLGFFVGALSLVPYLGGIGMPLAVLLLLFEELQQPGGERMAWWGILLWPSVVFVVVQVIEGYVLTPMIAGKATDLDPVTIVVAIIAGGSVAGVYGMLLAIPAAACGKILITQVLLPRIRAWSRGEARDPLPLQTMDEPSP